MKPVVDFARVRTFTCVIGVGSLGGGGITGRTRLRSRPMMGPHRRLQTINIAGSGAPKTARGEGTGERDRGSTTATGPRTTGQGITASLPPHRMPLDAEGWARETASSGRVSGAVAHCQKADVQRDGGTRSPTGCWVWETTGPPSDTAG